MSMGFERQVARPSGSVEDRQKAAADKAAQAKLAGYTGAICDVCGSPRMRMAGHCMVCEECGTSTGCS